MPRRKQNIGPQTSRAKRMRVSRANESQEENEARLTRERERRRRLRGESVLTADENSARTVSEIQMDTATTAADQENIQNSTVLWINKECSGMNYESTIDYKNDSSISLGSLNVICQHCSALKWKDESKGFCCLQGKIKINMISTPPEPLHSLLTGEHPKSKIFLKNIRLYNSAFQMTSFMSTQVVERGFMPTFKVQGQVYHLAGSLFPLRPDDHKFLQVYFIADPEIQTTTRCTRAPQPLDNVLVRQLQDLLHTHNNYIRSLKTAIESVPQNAPNFNIVIHADKVPAGEHRGRYNAPSTSEVAVIISDQQFDRRDIVIRSRDNNLQRISEIHRSYDALQYPLILCRGEDGYSINIPQVNPNDGSRLQKTVSCMNYYAHLIMTRQNSFNTILRFGMLTNQYLVDMYAKIESERLSYIRNNQTKLRVENYVHLQDALRGNEHSSDIGQVMILPSSFTGGPRYLHE